MTSPQNKQTASVVLARQTNSASEERLGFGGTSADNPDPPPTQSRTQRHAQPNNVRHVHTLANDDGRHPPEPLRELSQCIVTDTALEAPPQMVQHSASCSTTCRQAPPHLRPRVSRRSLSRSVHTLAIERRGSSPSRITLAFQQYFKYHAAEPLWWRLTAPC